MAGFESLKICRSKLIDLSIVSPISLISESHRVFSSFIFKDSFIPASSLSSRAKRGAVPASGMDLLGEFGGLPRSLRSLAMTDFFKRNSELIEGVAFIFAAGLLVFVSARLSARLAIAGGSLLFAAACQPTGKNVSFSSLEFNPRIRGDLGPSSGIREEGMRFMNIQQPQLEKSPFYPDTYSELEKLRQVDILWASAQFMQQNTWALNWDLVVSDFIFPDGEKGNIDKFRTCVPLTHPETGELFEGDPEIVTPVFNFNPFTVGLEVCHPSEEADESCTSYDLRKKLKIPEDNLLPFKQVGCYLGATLPSEILMGNHLSLTLFLADRKLNRDNLLGVRSTPYPLTPQIHVLEGCEVITRPLTYRPDLSTEARARWCWDASGNTGSTEFFTSDLPVDLSYGAKTCIEKIKDGKSECAPADGNYLNLGEIHDCGHMGEAAVFNLSTCAASPLQITPSHYINDPRLSINWCLEDRIPLGSDGKGGYRPPVWKKDDPLKIQLKVCAKGSE